MSERKRVPKDIRALGAGGPVRVAERPIGIDGTHQIADFKGRKPLMTGAGFFDEEQPVGRQPVTIRQVTESQAMPESSKKPLERAYRFMARAPLYRVQRIPRSERIIVPREIEVADDLFMGRLPMSLELNMDSEHLVMGKKGKPVPEIVGKSSLGAFAVADIRDLEVVDEYGDPVELALVDMRDRSLRRENEVLRFRREVSGELYYLNLPRAFSRRTT